MTRGFYIHKNSMDVFIEVLKVQYRGEKYQKLKVRWYNVGFEGKFWSLSDPQTIIVHSTHYTNWIRFDHARDWKEFRRKQLDANS